MKKKEAIDKKYAFKENKIKIKSDSLKNIPSQNNITNYTSPLLNELKFFENLRTNLLQWHLLNCEIKESMKNQAQKPEVLEKNISFLQFYI